MTATGTKKVRLVGLAATLSTSVVLMLAKNKLIVGIGKGHRLD